MKAGRELDALIAEKIMHLDNIRWREGSLYDDTDHKFLEYGSDYIAGIGNQIPDYSTNIYAAWEVVNKIGGWFQITQIAIEREEPFWSCEFGTDQAAGAATAPLAICMAALKVVE